MSCHNTSLYFFLPSNVPSSFSLTHLPSSLYLSPLRVFFKTCVIDIETLIKCRHLWLTETMKGEEEREEKCEGPGLGNKRHKTTWAAQAHSKSVNVAISTDIKFVLWQDVTLLIMLNICCGPQGAICQTINSNYSFSFFFLFF